MKLYTRIILDKLLKTILLFACFVEIVKGFFKYDLIEQLDEFKYMKYGKYFVYTLILIAFFMNISKLSFYLPFLGKTAFPTGVLKEQYPPNADLNFTLKNVEPNTKIVYWGSENPSKQPLPISNPWDAYKNYKNSGVTTSNKDGVAILRVVKPVSYKIPNGMTLKSHIHYREVIKDGMLGPVETAYI